MVKINYKQAIKLGFKREDISDSVFFDVYEFNYFTLTKEWDEGFVLNWDCNTRIVELKRMDKEANIKGILPINSLNELKTVIKFFE